MAADCGSLSAQPIHHSCKKRIAIRHFAPFCEEPPQQIVRVSLSTTAAGLINIVYRYRTLLAGVNQSLVFFLIANKICECRLLTKRSYCVPEHFNVTSTAIFPRFAHSSFSPSSMVIRFVRWRHRPARITPTPLLPHTPQIHHVSDLPSSSSVEKPISILFALPQKLIHLMRITKTSTR